jgi:YesN/AraC family two-component response regulator
MGIAMSFAQRGPRMAKPIPHILVVDDDPAVLEAVEMALQGESCVSLAKEARAAAAVLGREPVALVILDIRLPGQSGIALLAHLRQQSDVPVLLISGYGTKDLVAEGLEARANAYLDKPFTMPQLLAKVRALLAEGPRPDHIADRIRYLIEQRYQEPWSVQRLAKELRLSVRTLRRVFNCRYRRPVMVFLTEVRMGHAGNLVATTDLQMQEIAADVGIPDRHYFARVFRRYFGMSPREYRLAHRREPGSPSPSWPDTKVHI